jgi:hypothetical protein
LFVCEDDNKATVLPQPVADCSEARRHPIFISLLCDDVAAICPSGMLD